MRIVSNQNDDCPKASQVFVATKTIKVNELIHSDGVCLVAESIGGKKKYQRFITINTELFPVKSN